MENGNGGSFEGRSFICVRMLLFVLSMLALYTSCLQIRFGQLDSCICSLMLYWSVIFFHSYKSRMVVTKLFGHKYDLCSLRISGASKCKQNFNGEIIDFSPNSHRWNEETMSDADFCLGKGKMPVCQVAEFQLQNCISHSSGTGFCKKMQGSHKNLYNLECRAKQH